MCVYTDHIYICDILICMYIYNIYILECIYIRIFMYAIMYIHMHLSSIHFVCTNNEDP